MAELFIQNSWNLKYDTDFPVADRIGTVNLYGGGRHGADAGCRIHDQRVDRVAGGGEQRRPGAR